MQILQNIIFLAQSHIQGTEQEIPGIYIVGHPPTPPHKVYTVAYISIAVLFILAGVLQYFLRKWWLTGDTKNKSDNTPGENNTENPGNEKEENPGAVKFAGSKNFAIIVICVLFFFISLEAVLQIYVYYNPYQMFIPDPQAHWKINPAVQRKYQKPGPDAPIDSARDDGLVDWEYSRYKRKGAYRILCYGDSQTMGAPWVGGMKNSYPKILQGLLQKELPDQKIQVINMGVSGYSSYQGLLFFKNIGLLYNPDCIVVGLGFHDAGASYAPDKEITTDKPWLKTLRSVLYRSQIYLMIRKKILERRALNRKEDKRPVFNRATYEDYRENLKTFLDIGKEKKIRIIFLTVPQVSSDGSLHPDYMDVMRKASREFDVVLIDPVTEMKKIPPKEQEQYYTPDKVHFNIKGNQFMAEQINKVLAPILKKELESKPKEDKDEDKKSEETKKGKE